MNELKIKLSPRSTIARPALQSKEVSITENGQASITPDEGFYGLGIVSVETNVASVPDWTEIGYENTPNSMLTYFNYSKQICNTWNSEITSAYNLFRNDYSLLFMPLVDTSNITSMSNMFNGCANLCTIPLLNTSNVTLMSSMFYGCGRLVDLPVLDTKNVTTMSSMFLNGGASLSDESLNNLLKMCINAVNYTQTKKLSSIGLYQQLAERCTTLSNYQDFLNAGWTTGY